jgi:hypothetical protein
MLNWAQIENDYSLLPIDRKFYKDEWTYIQWNTPKQVKSMDYPISSIFCQCFQEELDVLQLRLMDQDGNILETDSIELNRMLQKMNLLEISIDYLHSIIPAGR